MTTLNPHDIRQNLILELSRHEYIGAKVGQRGWSIQRFRFGLRFAGRSIKMIRIHLNGAGSHDPLKVPRCHFHIGASGAHIPFPIMVPG